MKSLEASGLGASDKQAKSITEEEEENLWKKGFAGENASQMLVDTMVYMNALYFALRSRKEHEQLGHHPSQIQLIEDTGTNVHSYNTLRPFKQTYLED